MTIIEFVLLFVTLKHAIFGQKMSMESFPEGGTSSQDCGFPVGCLLLWHSQATGPEHSSASASKKRGRNEGKTSLNNPVNTTRVVTRRFKASVPNRTSVVHVLVHHYIKQHSLYSPLTLVHCICFGCTKDRRENSRDVFFT